MSKYIYQFSEGNKDMKELLGGKGANLAEMTSLGISVPPGFTITTEACRHYYRDNESISDNLLQEIENAITALEKMMHKQLGNTTAPLLVSVRSGSVFSMPGMMDTILNLGLNDETTIGLAKLNQDERFAYDSYRRFIQMFSDVVMGIEKYKFEYILSEYKTKFHYSDDSHISVEHLKEIVLLFKQIYQKEIGNPFPQNTKTQLLLAIEAVFKSWNNHRAKIYRQLHHISDDLGTAVNIQAMVFGNMGNDCGTGVCFSRNPVTGEKSLFGEYLINAQGEDVVAGIRTPQPIATLQTNMPAVYDELININHKLEKHYKDMQDIEFTVENNKLYILQTRQAKRTAQANISVAVDLVNEGILTKEEAILRISSDDINKLLHPSFDEKALKNASILTKGLAASPGASIGKICFTAKDAVNATEPVVLLREETSPEDIEGMIHSTAIVTARGGMTSHAAVVARGMGKCCVCGCQELIIDQDKKTVTIGNTILTENDTISVDGSTGYIYVGHVDKNNSHQNEKFATLMQWVNDIKQLNVYVNADNATDAKVGIDFGAEGIGLCRTEHMFFEENRIGFVRQMILANTLEERQKALNHLLDFQRQDFYDMFTILNGKSINIRLLDPPLHEFLPHELSQIEELAKELHISVDMLNERIDALKEFNPMMGHRGCRLGITYPEIYLMQARAITLAAIQATKEQHTVNIEIMIPLVSTKTELETLKQAITQQINHDINEARTSFSYKIGTMIELPRACFIADQLANHAEFFSFGTNDLTQMTYGFSRDDAPKFLDTYTKQHILEHDPFVHLDDSGVLQLMTIAVEKGRATRPDLKIGICGEHGGDERSILSVKELGLNYVSCSPYRVLIARLAAAKSAILTSNQLLK